MRKNSLTLIVVAALGLACAWAVASDARAQEIQVRGPLAGAPAIRHPRLYRRGRFMLAPTVAFTLQDEYERHIMFGLQAQYHFTDWLGLGVWGVYSPIQIATSLTDQIVGSNLDGTDQNRLSVPHGGFFDQQTGVIQWVAAAQLSFIPLRGKLALFQKLFVDSDLYIFAGGAVIGLEQRHDVTDPNLCASPNGGCEASQLARQSGMAFAPTFGMGLTFYASGLFGISLEYRLLPFSWNSSGTDERGGGPSADFPDHRIDSEDRLFHFTQLVSIGFVFYLPTSVPIGN